VEDLAPRIKDLKAQMDKLEEKRLDLMEAIRDVKGDLLETSVVRDYVDDLKALLCKGSIVEQKSFLRPSSSESRWTCRRWSSTTLSPSKHKR
jgi:hypothetical protein